MQSTFTGERVIGQPASPRLHRGAIALVLTLAASLTLSLLLAVVAAPGTASAVGWHPLAPSAASARNSGPPHDAVGIRLIDAPSNRADDPRARKYVIDHLKPGMTITRRIEISNQTGADQPVALYPAAATVKAGHFEFGIGRASNELTSWTKVDPPDVRLANGAKRVATVTIAVPRDAGDGERYGVVWAELPAATSSGGVKSVNRVGIRLYVSVGKGSEPASDFAIEAFAAKRDAKGRPVVSATVKNTGGRALDLSGTLRLRKGPGGLSAGPFDASIGTTLGIGETEPVTIPLDRALPDGPWSATIALQSGTTKRTATATITFPSTSGRTAKPVAVGADHSGRGWLVPVVALVLALLATTIAILVATRRRSRG